MFCFVCLFKATEFVFMYCVVKEWGWYPVVQTLPLFDVHVTVRRDKFL